jgi:hypothetical protein
MKHSHEAVIHEWMDNLSGDKSADRRYYIMPGRDKPYSLYFQDGDGDEQWLADFAQYEDAEFFSVLREEAAKGALRIWQNT